jgi:hypothetical protein
MQCQRTGTDWNGKENAMNPTVLLGLLIMLATNTAKAINMFMEVNPHMREFTARTEPILKVPI